VLGASPYLFAGAIPDQSIENFVNCMIRAFETYGGCAEYLVPDNLKSAGSCGTGMQTGARSSGVQLITKALTRKMQLPSINRFLAALLRGRLF
jgi:transposase